MRAVASSARPLSSVAPRLPQHCAISDGDRRLRRPQSLGLPNIGGVAPGAVAKAAPGICRPSMPVGMPGPRLPKGFTSSSGGKRPPQQTAGTFMDAVDAAERRYAWRPRSSRWCPPSRAAPPRGRRCDSGGADAGGRPSSESGRSRPQPRRVAGPGYDGRVGAQAVSGDAMRARSRRPVPDDLGSPGSFLVWIWRVSTATSPFGEAENRLRRRGIGAVVEEGK